ncbi:chorismate mutase [Mangrovibrevibacter kandeliae]|uniref:chorismate mutase n=1 Tax=Mangrovibrevibacter kandeliae TaxID=2968473 RepID=UPI0021187807|nr:chorismate mutase [Aurantimonas sp. CSK15Z-1]MCQ8783848.1 chorismate mutase [Aurantimonas sp. CSK15Z-1]
MTAAPRDAAARLAELRAQIDAIDESMHRLLMQRATVIDELIEVKGTARNGAAFRPGREADMMRRMVKRHQGHLPLTAIEHLWREIISTFTALQAPFDVVVAPGADVVAAVESARFYFGYSVPMRVCADASAVVDALGGGAQDRLGLVPLGDAEASWWDALDTVQIMARLPFFRADNRAAGLDAVVLSPPLADPGANEVSCFVVRTRDGSASTGDAVEVLASAERDGITSRLVACTGARAAVEAAFPAALDIRPVGGYAAPLQIPA